MVYILMKYFLNCQNINLSYINFSFLINILLNNGGSHKMCKKLSRQEPKAFCSSDNSAI